MNNKFAIWFVKNNWNIWLFLLLAGLGINLDMFVPNPNLLTYLVCTAYLIYIWIIAIIIGSNR